MLELDEMGSFVGRKVRKFWLCSAVERVIRRIVVWTLGSRGEASARRLWAAYLSPGLVPSAETNRQSILESGSSVCVRC